MSDSESDKAGHKAKPVSKALANAGKDAQSEEAENDGPAPSEEETEEEYEIEAILGHKRGAFPGVCILNRTVARVQHSTMLTFFPRAVLVTLSNGRDTEKRRTAG
jgi:hypothetical protein